MQRSPDTDLEVALLFDLGCLTDAVTQVVELGPTNVSTGVHLDLLDDRRVNREGTLHADAIGELANGEGLLYPTALTTNHNTLEHLDALLVALNHANVNLEGVPRGEVRYVCTEAGLIDEVGAVHNSCDPEVRSVERAQWAHAADGNANRQAIGGANPGLSKWLRVWHCEAVRIDVFTIFPDMVEGHASRALLGKARERGLLDVRTHDIREQATDVHRSVDDSPFGGGAGMVMMAEPIFASVEAADPPRPLLLLGPGGRRFDQAMAKELAATDGFSLLCGRYEGVDARVTDHLVDGEVSIGDYVLAGGEVGAMVILEAVGRLVDGVMGNNTSADEESFSDGLLEYPHYTRPAHFRDWEVPEVLRSGDHAKIARWRRAQALARTVSHRPDLLESRGGLSDAEQQLLCEFGL